MCEDLVDLDEALDKLTAEDPAKAELVKLRFFAGLTMPEVARLMGISLATAERHWTYTIPGKLRPLSSDLKSEMSDFKSVPSARIYRNPYYARTWLYAELNDRDDPAMS